MLKQKIRILIPLLLIAGLLIYTIIQSFSSDLKLGFLHYLALGLFVPLVKGFFKNIKLTTIYTGLYLVLATLNLLPLTPAITTSTGVSIGSLSIATSAFQLKAFGILAVYLILNFDILVGYYLDYKEAKAKKKER